MRTQYKIWTDDEVRQAAEIWERNNIGGYGNRVAVCALIAEALGRSIGSVSTRLHDCGPTFVHRRMVRPAPTIITPPEQDRQRRNDARDRMNLTGRVLGDPPPGYSALDKMRGLNP